MRASAALEDDQALCWWQDNQECQEIRVQAQTYLQISGCFGTTSMVTKNLLSTPKKRMCQIHHLHPQPKLSCKIISSRICLHTPIKNRSRLEVLADPVPISTNLKKESCEIKQEGRGSTQATTGPQCSRTAERLSQFSSCLTTWQSKDWAWLSRATQARTLAVQGGIQE